MGALQPKNAIKAMKINRDNFYPRLDLAAPELHDFSDLHQRADGPAAGKPDWLLRSIVVVAAMMAIAHFAL
jgi:hypothetical protein